MKKILNIISEALKGEEKEYTKGSIRRAIVLLAIPMILEMIMESLFAVADVFFVSKVGIDAVATVGMTESVVTLVYSVAIGMSMAATAMVARRIGEDKKEEALFTNQVISKKIKRILIFNQSLINSIQTLIIENFDKEELC